MKPSLRSRQEPRRVSNGVIIGAMLLSLCVLSIVKARYCATPFGTPAPFSSQHHPVLSIRSCGGVGSSLLLTLLCGLVRAGKAEDQLQEQMNSSIRMETEESPARTPGGESRAPSRP
jgi:hypothetical protein